MDILNFVLNGYAGDQAGEVNGRQPYRALISFTLAENHLPPEALSKSTPLGGGKEWFQSILADCLTPDSLPAIVTKCEEVGGNTYSLEVTAWKPTESKTKPWQPGVHLFAIAIGFHVPKKVGNERIEGLWPNTGKSATIVTVVVPRKVSKPIDVSELSPIADMLRRTPLAGIPDTWRRLKRLFP